MKIRNSVQSVCGTKKWRKKARTDENPEGRFIIHNSAGISVRPLYKQVFFGQNFVNSTCHDKIADIAFSGQFQQKNYENLSDSETRHGRDQNARQ
ncbi:MAG: hypothetical protein B6245_01335 [Desulfobacteraceae bacterium 4572_88]|nr:MAG: hypothetical protein B6245_01335 [Desulfobacteraceae bacterium 4572_88]